MDKTGRYDIQRLHADTLVNDLTNLDHETTCGIIEIVWGVVPDTLASGGSEDEEWKLHIGGPDWVVVKRVS